MKLIRDGEKGRKGVWRLGKREIIYLSLHCHHQNDSCIKMGSDDSHFNVSVGSDGQSHKTVSTNHSLSKETGAPKRYHRVLHVQRPYPWQHTYIWRRVRTVSTLTVPEREREEKKKKKDKTPAELSTGLLISGC